MSKSFLPKIGLSLSLLIAISSCTDQGNLEEVSPLKYQSTRDLPDTDLKTVYVYAYHSQLIFTVLKDYGSYATGYYSGDQGSYYGNYYYNGLPAGGYSGPYGGPGPIDKFQAYKNGWNNITEAEKALMRQNPTSAVAYYNAARIAENVSIQKWGSTVQGTLSLQRGNGDAFRHALLNALAVASTQNHNAEMVKRFADAHEENPNNNQLDKSMDLYNNEIGRQIAIANPNASFSELEQLVFQATLNGQLKQIINNTLAPTNGLGNSEGHFPE